jgi:hypothetical protein
MFKNERRQAIASRVFAPFGRAVGFESPTLRPRLEAKRAPASPTCGSFGGTNVGSEAPGDGVGGREGDGNAPERKGSSVRVLRRGCKNSLGGVRSIGYGRLSLAPKRKKAPDPRLSGKVWLRRPVGLVGLVGMAALAGHCGPPVVELEIPSNVDWLVVMETDSEEANPLYAQLSGRSGFMRRSDFTIKVDNRVGHSYVYGFREQRLRRYFASEESFHTLSTLIPEWTSPCEASLPTEWVADVTSSTVAIRDPREMPALIVPGMVEACPVLAGRPIEVPSTDKAVVAGTRSQVSQAGCLLTTSNQVTNARGGQVTLRINDLGEACLTGGSDFGIGLNSTCHTEQAAAADEYQISCPNDQSITIDAVPEHRLRCTEGDCRFSCKAGAAQCDGANGTCGYSLLEDESHCGACSTVCPEGVPCIAGACGGKVQFEGASGCALLPAGFVRCFNHNFICSEDCRRKCASACQGCCDERRDVALTYGMAFLPDRDSDESIPVRSLSGFGSELEPLCLVTTDGQVLCAQWGNGFGSDRQPKFAPDSPEKFAPVSGFGVAEKVFVAEWVSGLRYSSNSFSLLCATDGEGILRCARRKGTDWSAPEAVVVPGPVVDVAISGPDMCAVLRDGGVWCSDRSARETAALAPARRIFRLADLVCVISISGAAWCSLGASDTPPATLVPSGVRDVALYGFHPSGDSSAVILLVDGADALESTHLVAFDVWRGRFFDQGPDRFKELNGVVAIGLIDTRYFGILLSGIRSDGTPVYYD